MQLLKKLVPAAVLVVSAWGVRAAEPVTFNTPGDWNRPGSFVQTEDGGLRIAASAKFRARNPIHLDPKKTYRFSLKVRTAPGSQPAGFYMLFEPVTEEGRTISMHNVTNIKGSEAKLAADTDPASDVVLVTPVNHRYWTAASGWRLCFDAADDLSDLPNFSVSPVFKSVEKLADGNVKVTLRSPVKIAAKAGTPVRIHAGGAYIYVGVMGKTPDGWTEMSGEVSGIKPGWSNKTFPIGTAMFFPAMLANWGTKNTAFEIKDVKVEEL